MNAPDFSDQTDSPSNPQELYEELSAGAALGVLAPEEIDLWESVRKGHKFDPLPADLAQVATALAWTVPLKSPPARCREAVLDAVSRRAAHSDVALLPEPRSKLHFDALLPWAAAAIFAIASTLMAGGLARQKQEIAQLRSETFGPLQLSKALLTSADPASSAVARLIFCADVQQGRLVVRDLPPCPEGKSYQLWIVSKDVDTPVPVALFRVDKSGATAIDFKPEIRLAPMVRAMISMEDAKGSPTPSGPILLAGQ